MRQREDTPFDTTVLDGIIRGTEARINMIWLLPYDGSPDGSFYPGKSLVDIGGADIYAGDGNYDPQNALYMKCVGIFGSTVPVALHECGPIPDPTQLRRPVPAARGACWGQRRADRRARHPDLQTPSAPAAFRRWGSRGSSLGSPGQAVWRAPEKTRSQTLSEGPPRG